MSAKIVLASKSPRRIEMLRAFGCELIVRPADIDEGAIQAESPRELVRKLAFCKAQAIESFPEGYAVVGADTVVELGGEILGKPKGEDDAVRMLRALSGREHHVHTGMCVRFGQTAISDTVTAAVTFRALTDDEIRAYIATREPMDKAGAYGIQGLGSVFVSGIVGDYHAVVGLSLCRLHEMLIKAGSEGLMNN